MRCVVGCLILFLSVFTTSVHAKKGKLEQRDLEYLGRQISSITTSYSISTLLGEPVVNGAFKWEAVEGSENLSLPYSVYILLELTPEGNGSKTFIRVGPTVPDAGKGFGMNMSGSPNWDEFLMDSSRNYLSREEAIAFYKGGFEVTGFQLAGGEKEYQKELARKAELEKRKREREERKALEAKRRLEREKKEQERVALKKRQEEERKRELARREQERQQRDAALRRQKQAQQVREEQRLAQEAHRRREQERVQQHNQRILDQVNQGADSTQQQIQGINNTKDDLLYQMGY